MCDVIYDPTCIYGRINDVSARLPSCINLTYASAPPTVKGTAGSFTKYAVMLKGRNALSQVLNGLTSTAEFMLRLPTGIAPSAIKVWPGANWPLAVTMDAWPEARNAGRPPCMHMYTPANDAEPPGLCPSPTRSPLQA